MRGNLYRHERIAQSIVDTALFVPKVLIVGWQYARAELRDVLPEREAKKTESVEPIITQVHDAENVVSWVRAFEARHGRKPKLPEVEQQFPSIPRTTAWRRIKSA